MLLVPRKQERQIQSSRAKEVCHQKEKPQQSLAPAELCHAQASQLRPALWLLSLTPSDGCRIKHDTILLHNAKWGRGLLTKTSNCRLEHAERVTIDQSGGSEDLAGVVRQLEGENGEEELIQVTALIIGISGTGKSASINTLLGYDAVTADAFNGTSKVDSHENPS